MYAWSRFTGDLHLVPFSSLYVYVCVCVCICVHTCLQFESKLECWQLGTFTTKCAFPLSKDILLIKTRKFSLDTTLVSNLEFSPRSHFTNSSFFVTGVFQPHHQACGIFVPWPGMDPAPSAMEAQSRNHWTTREVPPVMGSIVAFSQSRISHCI